MMEYRHLLKLPEIKEAFGVELKKYGTDYSDIGTIHFMDEDSDLQRLVDTGVIDHAFELKKQGLIRNVAFSSHTPSVARKALDAADFDVMFFGVNAGYDYEMSDEGLGESEELPVDFNEKLFHRLVDHATVYPDDSVVFTFRNGAEISMGI